MTIHNDIILWDNGVDKLCLYSLPTEQQYQYTDGVPCITFGISYENAHFKGYDSLTLFDYADLRSTIEKAYHLLDGSFQLYDMGADTDSHIHFKMHNSRLSVKGQLGSSVSSHSLRFEFEADQTLLGQFIQAITI